MVYLKFVNFSFVEVWILRFVKFVKVLQLEVFGCSDLGHDSCPLWPDVFEIEENQDNYGHEQGHKGYEEDLYARSKLFVIQITATGEVDAQDTSEGKNGGDNLKPCQGLPDH